MSKIRTALFLAPVMALALPFTAHEEGLRTKAYLDSVGVPTICYGHTEGVRLGDVKTEKECTKIFYAELGMYAAAIDMMVKPAIKPATHAAFTSWAYNVGLGAARKSTLIKLANKPDIKAACDELLKWKNAGGKPILLERRKRERTLCMEGL